MACTEKNPLQREGTSTATRRLPALNPSFARPDERQIPDLLRYLQQYATCLRFYNADNAPDGDWQALLESDPSFVLAALTVLDIPRSNAYKKQLFQRIQTGDDASAAKAFKHLFDLLFSLPLILIRQVRLLPGGFEDKTEMTNLVQAKLLGPVVNLQSLFLVFISQGLIDSGADLDSMAPLPVLSSTGFTLAQLGSEWVLPAPSVSLTLPDFSSRQQTILYLVHHNLFTAEIDGLFRVAAALLAKANTAFAATLQNFPGHQPHLALLLSFLKLFGTVQEELNQYGRRHLDFYYKEVLRLQSKAAEPDMVHLLFTLQKGVDKHLLQKGTLLKGGKDNLTRKETNYAITEDVVLNKATVESVKAIRLQPGAKPKLIGYSKADSEDGEGAQLLAPDKSWFAFGNPVVSPATALGFGLASNLLFLNEGRRTVTVTVTFAPGTTRFAESFPVSHAAFFTSALTGSKGWLYPPVVVQGSRRGDTLRFSLTLNPSDPAIVAYDEALHKAGIDMDLPLLRIFLNQSNRASYPFRNLMLDRIISVTLSIAVEGVKDLSLSNDSATIDPSKPFKPFGEFPENGASFYIGSKEIFQKPLTELRFVFGNSVSHDEEVHYLFNGDWSHSQRLAPNTDTLSLAGNVFPPAALDFRGNEPLLASTTEGFLRLRLNSSRYSMAQYLGEVKDQINSTTVKKTANDPVTYRINTGNLATPPALLLSSFAINYKASALVSFTGAGSDPRTRFLHLFPFGYAGVAFDAGQPSKKITLLRLLENAGELFIGLKEANPEETVSLLVQVAEGSSNPLKEAAEVKWSYLTNENEWVLFESRFVVDRTHSFTQSGIVGLTLPKEIGLATTLLPKGRAWIRAAVTQNTDAVCKLIQVQAGAASAGLVQQNGIYFSQTLPAGTVSKLEKGEAAIKSIVQPFDSIGGRPAEDDAAYYLRTSEHLRHKQRGITVWDYEHLVLEAFPQISKVRCINNAGFFKTSGNAELFCENGPGHVTLVTIPDFQNKAGIDPLKPYTPVGLLKNIESFLRARISPFVKLHVKNPAFEEVQLQFNVSFHEPMDDAFYRQLLAAEIEQFLTPWAFGQGDLSFGSRVSKSVLLNFVEERPYVDFVTCFQLHQVVRRQGALHLEERRNVEEAVPTTARSLLVSYRNELTGNTHLISSPANCIC